MVWQKWMEYKYKKIKLSADAMRGLKACILARMSPRLIALGLSKSDRILQKFLKFVKPNSFHFE